MEQNQNLRNDASFEFHDHSHYLFRAPVHCCPVVSMKGPKRYLRLGIYIPTHYYKALLPTFNIFMQVSGSIHYFRKLQCNAICPEQMIYYSLISLVTMNYVNN